MPTWGAPPMQPAKADAGSAAAMVEKLASQKKLSLRAQQELRSSLAGADQPVFESGHTSMLCARKNTTTLLRL